MGSSRLPGKVLEDLGGRPMLRFQLDRLAPLDVDHLVVATSTLARDDAIAEVAAAGGTPVVRGPEADVLERFLVALRTYPADTVVRLTGDCPLSDPGIIGEVVALHHERGADYTSNVFPRTFPKGLDVEVVSADALRTAAAEATDAAEREHVTPYLYRHPERFRLANLRSGLGLGDERWTVDTRDDLAEVRRIVAEVGGDGGFSSIDALERSGRRPPPAPGTVHLRPAEITDSADLLRWRNDPDAVRFSRTGRAVDASEHENWLAQSLDDPATRLVIAELDGEPVGQLRVDVHDATGTVSIAVAPEHRGRGLGRRLLMALQRDLRDDYQVSLLVAEIAPQNDASRRAVPRR